MQASCPAAPPAVAIDDDSSEKLVQCKVVGCDGRAFVDKTDALFRCPLCNHYTCINCEAVHESMTCAQYRENKDSIAAPVHKPRRQSEEDSEEAEVEKPEQPAADDDAEGMIVDCCYEGCSGYAYVFKTATVAKCELCEHWTCVSCKACHESQSCAVYKGIDVPEECAAQEPTVSENQRRGRNREQKSVSAGSTEHGGFLSGVLKNFGKLLSGSGSGTVEQSPAQMPLASSSADNYRSHPGRVPCARGHTEFEKVQGNGIPPCDACSSRKSDHTAKECQHALCRQCIQKSVEKATVYRSVPCPAPAANSQPCRGHLREEEVQQVVPRNILRNLFKKSDWRDSQCFDKRCSHAFRRKKGAQFFTCPMCRRKNCADCHAIHEGMTCEQYIEKFVADMDRGKLENPEEKKKRLQEQIALYERPSIQTTEEFECPICLVEVEPGMGIVLKNCHHQICEQCLADTAKNSQAAEVLCPCKSDDADCQMPVLDSDLRACLSEADYAALQERGLREAENTSKEPSFHCKTPDCKGWCLHGREVEVFDCPVCKRQNCLRCEAIHKDMSCADYQADLKRRAENDVAARASLNFLEEMLKTEQAMRCPQCRVVIIKRSGCDFMVCTSCKTQLCWATKGARWGPGGQGDTSGGCRCGLQEERVGNGAVRPGVRFRPKDDSVVIQELVGFNKTVFEDFLHMPDNCGEIRDEIKNTSRSRPVL
ncbi:hypothetical protein V5799_025525 [Amblyomma americanum]|uniref:Ubiquitin conjugating enzyme n=1 Tax=Amblyomma americanum TaxID=6943 RepID=A0AAQ4E982_AMBAM